MKIAGHITISLNESTMINAVQMLLDSLTKNPVGKVTSITAKNDGGSQTFECRMSEIPEANE